MTRNRPPVGCSSRGQFDYRAADGQDPGGWVQFAGPQSVSSPHRRPLSMSVSTSSLKSSSGRASYSRSNCSGVMIRRGLSGRAAFHSPAGVDGDDLVLKSHGENGVKNGGFAVWIVRGLAPLACIQVTHCRTYWAMMSRISIGRKKGSKRCGSALRRRLAAGFQLMVGEPLLYCVHVEGLPAAAGTPCLPALTAGLRFLSGGDGFLLVRSCLPTAPCLGCRGSKPCSAACHPGRAASGKIP